jgi:3'-phosphoadenosine 5'-phosphosulfate sulfotransferase
MGMAGNEFRVVINVKRIYVLLLTSCSLKAEAGTTDWLAEGEEIADGAEKVRSMEVFGLPALIRILRAVERPTVAWDGDVKEVTGERSQLRCSYELSRNFKINIHQRFSPFPVDLSIIN